MKLQRTGITSYRTGIAPQSHGDWTLNARGSVPILLKIHLKSYLNIPLTIRRLVMNNPTDSQRPKGQALQQVLTQVGVVALRMEGEMISPLKVQRMRERRQREYTEKAYEFLRNNLDWFYLNDVLDPQTIPVDSLAHEIACSYHNRAALNHYNNRLWQWVESQQIGFDVGDYSPECPKCFDTGCDFHEYVRTGLQHDLHNPTQCTQCPKGKQ